MKNWIDIRRWERPDRPQPVYTGALSLWEAPLYAAIAAASLLCSVRPPAEPGFDVRTHSSAPADSGRIFTNLPAVTPPTVAQTMPAMAQATASFRSTAEAGLDVRLHVSETNFGVPDDATVDQRAGIWAQQAAPGLTPSRARLDPRTHVWQPPPGWYFTSLPADATVAQRAAVWSQTANPGRTADRPTLEVRHTWQAPNGWVVTNFAPDATVGQQAAIWAQQANAQYARTRDRGGDVRRIQTEPAFGWVAKVVDAIVATWAPIFDAQASPRTFARAVLDVRAVSDMPEIAWWSPTLPPPPSVSESLRVLIGPTHPRTLIGPTHRRDLIS